MGRFFLTILLGVALFGLVAYQMGLYPFSSPTITGPINPGVAATPREQLGPPLYAPAPEKVQVPGQVRGRDPVVVYGHMNVMDKINVASQVAGQLLFVGTDVPEGAAQVAGVAVFLGEDYEYAKINHGDRDLIQLYRRLYEGRDLVQRDQMVAMVDPAKILGELEESRFKVIIAQFEEQAAKAASEEADARHSRAKVLWIQRNMPDEEYGTYKLAAIKYTHDHRVKQKAIDAAEAKNRTVEITYKQFEVRNKIPKQLCLINSIFLQTGGAVRQDEPVMELWSLERLQAEALLPAQYQSRLSGSRIAIEPIQEQDPYKVLKSHRGPVNVVAVSGDEKNPLILSASEDKTVCVWTPTAPGPIRVLRHDAPVRGLACAPAGAKFNYWLTADADGGVFYWNLDKESDQQKTKLPLAHRDGHHATSLAISPDGQYFASGGTDGHIFLYRAGEEPILLFGFDPEHGVDQPHQGPITSLALTPQARLISASRDQTIRVWELLEKGAVPLGNVIDRRSGNVHQLGVSSDGGWMLFDQGKDLQILTVPDGRTVNTLYNPAGGIPFETLALFSPTSKDYPTLLLTGGGAEGRLQLWRSPTESARGYAVRQLVPPQRITMTCAAFSSYPGLGVAAPFVASGSQEGHLYLWPLPAADEVKGHRSYDVRLKLQAQSQDASGQIRIGVEVPNRVSPEFPNGRFRPGQPVTIVFE